MSELEAHLTRWEANGPKDKVVEDLQRTGALIADMFAGTLYLALAGYVDRAPLVASSDTTALDGFSALGLLVGDADWRVALCKSTRALLSAAAKDAVTPKLVGEFLVMIEQGISAESGVRRAAVPVRAALGVDTQVYQYAEEDLTPEMINEGAKERRPSLGSLTPKKLGGVRLREGAFERRSSDGLKVLLEPESEESEGQASADCKRQAHAKGLPGP